MVGAFNAGDYELQGAVVIQAAKGTSAGITKGDVVALTSDKWVTAAVNAGGPFGVALETKLTADTTIKILIQGIVYVTFNGAVNPNARVMVSGATAGQVVVSTDAGATQGQVTAFQRNVGIYLGHENEGDGSTIATAAANTDVARIFVGGGF